VGGHLSAFLNLVPLEPYGLLGTLPLGNLPLDSPSAGKSLTNLVESHFITLVRRLGVCLIAGLNVLLLPLSGRKGRGLSRREVCRVARPSVRKHQQANVKK
jgi:hypothetical protein